jgi:hypothetical protein
MLLKLGLFDDSDEIRERDNRSCPEPKIEYSHAFLTQIDLLVPRLETERRKDKK